MKPVPGAEKVGGHCSKTSVWLGWAPCFFWALLPSANTHSWHQAEEEAAVIPGGSSPGEGVGAREQAQSCQALSSKCMLHDCLLARADITWMTPKSREVFSTDEGGGKRKRQNIFNRSRGEKRQCF